MKDEHLLESKVSTFSEFKIDGQPRLMIFEMVVRSGKLSLNVADTALAMLSPIKMTSALARVSVARRMLLVSLVILLNRSLSANRAVLLTRKCSPLVVNTQQRATRIVENVAISIM